MCEGCLCRRFSRTGVFSLFPQCRADKCLMDIRVAAPFEWRVSFDVGIPEIDEQHRRIFRLLGTFESMVKTNLDKLKVQALLEELMENASHHFAAEERLMAQHRYSRLDHHRRQHEHLLARVEAYILQWKRGEESVVNEVPAFMKMWIIQHIVNSDQQYVPCIRAKADRT